MLHSTRDTANSNLQISIGTILTTTRRRGKCTVVKRPMSTSEALHEERCCFFVLCLRREGMHDPLCMVACSTLVKYMSVAAMASRYNALFISCITMQPNATVWSLRWNLLSTYKSQAGVAWIQTCTATSRFMSCIPWAALRQLFTVYFVTHCSQIMVMKH